MLAGALLIGSGLLHISAAGDPTNLPVMLAGFLVVATLQAGLGGLLLLRRPGGLLVAGGLALTLAALGTWLLSRTAGLPFLPGGHMEEIGFKDGVTVLFEVGTLPALAMLASSDLDQVRLPSARLGSQAVAVLGAGMFALFVPAFTLGGGEHHSRDEMAAHGHGEKAGESPHGGDEAAHASTGGGHGHGGNTGHGDRGNAHGGAGHDDGGQHDDGDGHHDGSELASLTPADHAHGGGAGKHHRTGHGDGGSDHGHRRADRHDEGGHGDGGDGHHDDGDDGHGPGHRGDDQGHGDGHGDTDGHDDSHAAEAPGNERALALESGHPADANRPARGPALVFHDKANEEMNGAGHAHSPCNPTPTQQAAADTIAREVQAELRQYENNPAEALADGFNYVFGPTDRMLHMVHLGRMSDSTVLKATEIESFIYYMTDTGFVPIGGMFVMPNADMPAPEPGGCLTQWHHHGGFIGRWATAGTSDQTPPMMHVFTYPGLDPWGHYTGRDLAPLWLPGRWLPSVCRESGDANDGCLP